MKKRQRRVTMMAAAVVAAVLGGLFAVWWLHIPMPWPVPSRPIVVTEKDQGRVVNMYVGQQLEVRLPSNVYGGRSWRVGRPLPFLPQTGDVTFSATLFSAKPGDGYQSTTFTAIDKGSGPLFLGSLADNDQNSYQPSQSFSVSVNVR